MPGRIRIAFFRPIGLVMNALINRTTLVCVGFAVSCAAGAADIQKCADANGGITYQDRPCSRGSTLGSLPRESAKGDPDAIRRLDQERARIGRVADAQLSAAQGPQQ